MTRDDASRTDNTSITQNRPLENHDILADENVVADCHWRDAGSFVDMAQPRIQRVEIAVVAPESTANNSTVSNPDTRLDPFAFGDEGNIIAENAILADLNSRSGTARLQIRIG